MQWYFVLSLILGSLAASLVSGYVGFGGALLLLPVLSAILGTETAVPVLTIAQLIGNCARMFMGINEVEWKSVGLFSLSALPLTALGAFGFSLISTSVTSRIIGALILTSVALKAIFKNKQPRLGNAAIIAGGGGVGLISGLAGSAGPLSAMLFLSLNLAPSAYIATEAAAATLMHIVKSLVYGKFSEITIDSLMLGITMGAVMVLGTYISKHLLKISKAKTFYIVASVLLAAVGLYMLVFGM